MRFKITLSIIVILFPIFGINNSEIDDITYNYVSNEIYDAFSIIETEKGPYTGNNETAMTSSSLKTYYGPMTAYGPDCIGCSGITSSGYNVLNGNIFYKDKTFGNIRILAADKALPFGTIVRITGLKDYDDGVIGIVLDRGSAIGFNKHSYFDLLYKSEKDTLTFGCQYATYEILRFGY